MQSKIVSEEQELSLEPTVLSSAVPAIRKGMKIASDAAPPTKAAPILLTEIKADSSVGINVRSGRQYYDKWDKVAEDELQKLDSEDKPSAATASSTGISAGLVSLVDVASGQCNLPTFSDKQPAEQLMMFSILATFPYSPESSENCAMCSFWACIPIAAFIPLLQ